MLHDTEQRYQTLRTAFAKAGQDHVFKFWHELGEAERDLLLDDLERINVAALPRLARLAGSPAGHSLSAGSIQPVTVVPRETVSADVIARGRALISAGRVAAFTVAGGQGTRLGYDGPKGALPISPIRNKPLFQLFAEFIRGTDRRYGCRTQWYIMTSPANDQATQSFFRENGCFGMSSQAVSFFQQGVMPAFDRSGRILLDQKNRLALAPDGHGGSLLALANTGMLEDMARRGIEYISYFQVDNPLVMCLDPAFIGLHAAGGAEMSSKAVSKADDLEKVGNFAMVDGRQVVIEYSDLPNELAIARSPDGTRKFDAGSIAIHVLSRSFVERLTADRASFGLPWHLARKKVPFIDLASGRRIEPAEPNAVKLEAFVFDALPLADNPLVLGTVREEEFSPVKNPTGVDSIESAKRDMNRRAASWLESAGFRIPRDPSGESQGRFEVSPLLALDSAHLRERRLPPRVVNAGADVYIE